MDQVSYGAVGRVQGLGQTFYVVHDFDGAVVERLVDQEGPNGALAALDVVDDPVYAVHDFLHGGQRRGTLLEQILDLGSIGAGDFRSGLDGLLAHPLLDIHVAAAEQILLCELGRGIHRHQRHGLVIDTQGEFHNPVRDRSSRKAQSSSLCRSGCRSAGPASLPRSWRPNHPDRCRRPWFCGTTD